MAEPAILSASGTTRITLGATVSAKVGDLIGHDGTNYVLADADLRVPARFMAMETVAVGAAIAVCESGVLFDSDAPYTAGASQYLSATAGAHGAIPAISATLTLLQRVGHATTTDTLVFNLSRILPVLLRAQVAYDPASLATVLARSDALALTGILATDIVHGGFDELLTGTGWNTGLVIQHVIASAANEVTVRLVNPTAGALDGAAVTLDLYVDRP